MKLALKHSALLLSSVLFSASCAHTHVPEAEVVEVVYTFEKIRPANMAISTTGQLFVTGHPIVDSDIKVVEVLPDGQKSVYPNDFYSNSTEQEAVIGASIGIHVDSKDNLWILDLAKHQFVVWNISTDSLVRIIKLPNEVLVEHAFLQDFVYDEKHNRIIISDMSQGDLKSAPNPAFVVIDLTDNMAYRVAKNHPSMQPDMQGGLGLNPIAIDPQFEYIYFGAMHGKKVYRVKTSAFSDPASVGQQIEYYAPKSYSDGIKVDGEGNVYVTDIQQQAIGVANPEGYHIIATLPDGQSWPDGLALKDGYVYAVVNQLDRTAALNNGIDATVGKFVIVRTPEYKLTQPKGQ